jgi:hypothetical protein
MQENEEFKKYSEQKFKEIKLWIIAASVIPIVALAGLFFVWAFGTKELLDTVMVVGSSTMFTIAVLWWWWAMQSIYKLISLWQNTEENVKDVKIGIREIKDVIVQVLKVNDK